MANFTGQLKSNEIFASLFNMIISQEVQSDDMSGNFLRLVDKARVDGGLYGDTKLYYSADVLGSQPWGVDEEAGNLLALDRPEDPKTQAITLDVFRQIRLTVDNYLSKRAWSTEGAFSEFNSLMLTRMRDTKRVYDGTTYNAFIGTDDVPAEDITIDNTEGTTVGKAIADIVAKVEDTSRDYNEYGHLKSFDEAQIKVIWNVDVVNSITKLSLPVIYHNDNLVSHLTDDKLPARFFGTINSAGTQGKADGSVRSLVEQVIGSNHYFAGDAIKTTDTAPAKTSYTVDPKVVAKIYVKLPPFMSAFEVGTSFFNARSLTENHYLTWGHNTLEHLKGYPCITIRTK